MADAFNKEAFTLLGVGTFIIGLRTFARVHAAKSLSHLAADDYLMLFAAVIYGLETGAAYSVGALFMGLANNSMTPQQRKELSPDSEEYRLRVDGSKLQLMGWSSYTLLLWTLKTCVCIYYSRMTNGIAHMRIRIRIGFAVIFISYVATISSILGGCGIPFKKNWQIEPDPGNHCQPAISHIDLFVTLILNVLTDAYLLSIPIPLLWRSQISAKEKIWLIILFSGAVFIMMAGILRCVLILTAGAKSAQQAGSWAVRETFVAVVVSNMPIIYSLLRGIFKSISKYTITISKRSTVSSSRHVRLGDLSGSRERHFRSDRSRDAFPVTSSSFEQIIQEEDMESKPHGYRDLEPGASTAQCGPLPKKALEGEDPNAEYRSPHIRVATRTTVCSEAASPTLHKGTSSADGLYQCSVSADRDIPPMRR